MPLTASAVTGEGRAPAILLTGRPGSGKTTAILRIVKALGMGRCAGFYTEEVREGGRRVGFDVVTLEGKRGPLARVGRSGPRVGRYGVDVETFEQVGVSALEDALDDRGRLLVVDEIGKMELLSETFRTLLPLLFRDGAAPLLGTVMRGRHPALDPVRRRHDVKLIEVTIQNREKLPGKLTRFFQRYFSSRGS